jgi:hypothetical protein
VRGREKRIKAGTKGSGRSVLYTHDPRDNAGGYSAAHKGYVAQPNSETHSAMLQREIPPKKARSMGVDDTQASQTLHEASSSPQAVTPGAKGMYGHVGRASPALHHICHDRPLNMEERKIPRVIRVTRRHNNGALYPLVLSSRLTLCRQPHAVTRMKWFCHIFSMSRMH